MPLTTRYRRLSLRAKLALWVSAGVSVLVVTLMLAILLTLQQEMTRSVTQLQATLIGGVARDLDGKLAMRLDLLQQSVEPLGGRIALREGPEVDAFFAERRVLRHAFDVIALAAADGTVAYSSVVPPGQPKVPMSDRGYFHEVLRTGQPVVTPPLLSRIESKPVVSFAVPVKDGAGATVGVLVGLVRLDKPNFISGIGGLSIGDAGYFILSSRAETPIVIAHPNADRLMKPLAHRFDPGWRAALAAGGVPSEGTDADGVPVLFTRLALDSVPWMLEAVYPTQEAYAGLRQRQHQVLILGALIAVVSWALVWLLMTVQLAPLGKLRRALELDAAGAEEPLQAIRADSADLAALLAAYYAQKRARLATQTALDASERRLRDVADNMPAFVAYLDRDGIYRYVNARYQSVLGIPPSKMLGKSIADGLNERVYRSVAPYIAAVLRGEAQTFEHQVSGHPQIEHLLVTYLPDVDAQGEVVGFYATTLDITGRKRAELRLKASQQLLDRTGSIAGVGGWELDLAPGNLSWTAQTRLIHEVDDDFVPSVTSAIGFYTDAGQTAIDRAVLEGMERGTPWDMVLPFKTAKGRARWVRSTGEVEFEDGRPARMFGAVQDVTQLVDHERRLREQAELLQVTLNSIGDGVITTDLHGAVQWLNPVAERMTGWTSEGARGRPSAQVFHVIHADTRAVAPDPVELCLRTLGAAGLPGRSVLVSADGQEHAIEDSASPIRDEYGIVRGAVLVFHDVSEQRRMNDQMTHRATHDELTGLVNRAGFETRLTRVLGQAREGGAGGALMFIDLDQFKLVNDACGHAMGDKLLCQVSELLRQSVRTRDTLARLGGDEFGVLLEHCTVDQAQRVAQSICDRMEEFRFVHDGRRFRIGTSIGLVPVDHRWPTQTALQQAADSACYAAKDAGRNRVQVWFDSDVAMRGRDSDTQWGSRLEDALDDNDFVLYGQRIEASRGADGGLHFEVLVRLREADGSIVPPGRFLPAAERFHMASRIDRWVLRRAFEWLVEAEKSSPGVIGTMSINLSGQSVGDREFHRHVVELLRELPVDATRLCFEVTETAAITNLADATAFIRSMRLLGMRVALDDFGAGASSFGYLKNLPVDFLKIDGQFIVNIERDPLDMAAVRCFHEVARAIGVRTVAEFVETEAVRKVLQDIGIDFLQGYLLHRPEPIDDLLRLARAERGHLALPLPQS